MLKVQWPNPDVGWMDSEKVKLNLSTLGELKNESISKKRVPLKWCPSNRYVRVWWLFGHGNCFLQCIKKHSAWKHPVNKNTHVQGFWVWLAAHKIWGHFLRLRKREPRAESSESRAEDGRNMTASRLPGCSERRTHVHLLSIKLL